GTEIPLCSHVQANGFGHLGTEPFAQPTRTRNLMMCIDGPVGDVVGHGCDQMSNVMQQGCSDDGFPRAFQPREVSSLQPMLGHGNSLAEVGGRAASGVKRKYLIDDAHVGTASVSSAARLNTLSRVM